MVHQLWVKWLNFNLFYNININSYIHCHNTRLKIKKLLQIFLKLKTTFAKSKPYYVFIYICVKFKINPQDFYNPVNFKQLVDTIVNIAVNLVHYISIRSKFTLMLRLYYIYFINFRNGLNIKFFDLEFELKLLYCSNSNPKLIRTIFEPPSF